MIFIINIIEILMICVISVKSECVNTVSHEHWILYTRQIKVYQVSAENVTGLTPIASFTCSNTDCTIVDRTNLEDGQYLEKFQHTNTLKIINKSFFRIFKNSSSINYKNAFVKVKDHYDQGYFVDHKSDISDLYVWDTENLHALIFYANSAKETVSKTIPSLRYVTFTQRDESYTLRLIETLKDPFVWSTDNNFLFLSQPHAPIYFFKFALSHEIIPEQFLQKCQGSLDTTDKTNNINNYYYSSNNNHEIFTANDSSTSVDGTDSTINNTNTLTHEYNTINYNIIYAINACVGFFLIIIVMVYPYVKKIREKKNQPLRPASSDITTNENQTTIDDQPIYEEDIRSLYEEPTDVNEYAVVGSTDTKLYDLKGNRLPMGQQDTYDFVYVDNKSIL